jgi:hypothetical protein
MERITEFLSPLKVNLVGLLLDPDNPRLRNVVKPSDSTAVNLARLKAKFARAAGSTQTPPGS